MGGPQLPRIQKDWRKTGREGWILRVEKGGWGIQRRALRGLRGVCFFLLDYFPSFFRSFSIVIVYSFVFATPIGKMPIFMTYLALEWQLLVIHLLNVRPLVHFELDCFR